MGRKCFRAEWIETSLVCVSPPHDPVPDGAVCQAGVGVFVAGGKIGDLGAVDQPLGHAIA